MRRFVLPTVLLGMALGACDSILDIQDHQVASEADDGTDGGGVGGVPAFLGAWSLSGTETLADCTNLTSCPGGKNPSTRTVTWVAGGPGLVGTGGTCSFQDTVSGDTAVLDGTVSCSFTVDGDNATQDIESFTWVLSPDGTTAQVTETGTQTQDLAGGGSCTCTMTRSETATRQVADE